MSLVGAKFICLDEAGEPGRAFEAKGRQFTVGYYMACDYILDDSRAMGVHCEIQCDAFGRVVIYNLSKQHPISLNGHPITIKRQLMSGSIIQILDNKFLWDFPRTTNVENKDLVTSDSSTPQKQLGIPQQKPNSCPDFKLHRDLHKRLTVHNFAYCIDSDEEGNISTEVDKLEVTISSMDKNKTQKDKEQSNFVHQAADITSDLTTKGEVRVVSPDPAKAAPLSAIEYSPKMNLINSTQNKENTSTQKKKELLSLCHQSDIVITSFSPRETGVRIEKSFTAIVKPTTTTPKSVYSTPKAALSEWNDDDSYDFIDFSTPATSKKCQYRTAANSSMHLIDLTTPSKLRPLSPLIKPALKNDTVRARLLSQKLGVSALSATPTAAVAVTHTPSTVGSVISVNSTDSSSVIEVSETGTSRLEIIQPIAVAATESVLSKMTITPKRTPQSLMKRALLTSAKKQHHTARYLRSPTSRVLDVSSPANTTTWSPATKIRTPLQVLRRSFKPLTHKVLDAAKLKRADPTTSPCGASTSLAAAHRSSFNLTPVNRASTLTLSTSTPLGMSTCKLRAGTKTSPLNKVRKSCAGGSTLLSQISKVRAHVPPSRSAQLLARARRSLCSPAKTRTSVNTTSINILKTLKYNQQAITADLPKRTLLFTEEPIRDELNRTFTLCFDDEVESSDVKQKLKDQTISFSKTATVNKNVSCTSSKEMKEQDNIDITFSPIPQKTENVELPEVPVDVCEVRFEPQCSFTVLSGQHELAGQNSEDISVALQQKLPQNIDDIEVICESFGEILEESSLAANINDAAGEKEIEYFNKIDPKELMEKEQKLKLLSINKGTKEKALVENVALDQLKAGESKKELKKIDSNENKAKGYNIVENVAKTMEQQLEAEGSKSNPIVVMAKQFGEYNIERKNTEENIAVSIKKELTFEEPKALHSLTELVDREANKKCNELKTDSISKYEVVEQKRNLNDEMPASDIMSSEQTPDTAKLSDEYILLSGETEGTADLLEEIEYVLNKSDELKQKQLLKCEVLNEKTHVEVSHENRIFGCEPNIEESKVSEIDDEDKNEDTYLEDVDSYSKSALIKSKNNSDKNKDQTPKVVDLSSEATPSDATKNIDVTNKTQSPKAVDLISGPISSYSENKPIEEQSSKVVDSTSELFLADPKYPSIDVEQKENCVRMPVAKQRVENCAKMDPSTPNFRGLRDVLRTPKHHDTKTPRYAGLRDLMRTPKAYQNDDIEVLEGVSSLLKTPKYIKVSDCKETAASSSAKPEPQVCTPRRSARRASMSADIINSASLYTPKCKTRRASLSSEATAKITPKRSITLDDDSIPPTPQGKTPRPKRIALIDESVEEMGAIVEEEAEPVKEDNSTESLETSERHESLTERCIQKNTPDTYLIKSVDNNTNECHKEIGKVNREGDEDLFDDFNVKTGSSKPEKITTEGVEEVPQAELDDIAIAYTKEPVKYEVGVMMQSSGEELPSSSRANLEEEPFEKEVEHMLTKCGEDRIIQPVEKDTCVVTTKLSDKLDESTDVNAESPIIEESICEEISGAVPHTEHEKSEHYEFDESKETSNESDINSTNKPEPAIRDVEIQEIIDDSCEIIEYSSDKSLQDIIENNSCEIIEDSNDASDKACAEEVLQTLKSNESVSEILDVSEYDYGREVNDSKASVVENIAPMDIATKSEAGAQKTSKSKSVKLKVQSPKTPVMIGMRELLKTPKANAATPTFAGLCDLVSTPKAKMNALKTLKADIKAKSLDTELEDQPQNTSAAAEEKLVGLREMLKTTKCSSTPRFKGIKELMQIPKVCSTPLFSGIKELMDTPAQRKSGNSHVSALTEPSAIEREMDSNMASNQFEDEDLEKFFKTPRAKNVMIPNMPPSAVIQKSSDSVEMINPTEYIFNDTTIDKLDDIFQTSMTNCTRDTPTDTIEEESVDKTSSQPKSVISGTVNAEESRSTHYLSAEEAFDKLAEEKLTYHSPVRKVYTRKPPTHSVPPSPFSVTDVISDLPKTDIQEWVDSLENVEPSADEFEDNFAQVEEQEIAMGASITGKYTHDISNDPLSTSTLRHCSSTHLMGTCDAYNNTIASEAMVNISAVSSVIDPLGSSALKSANNKFPEMQRLSPTKEIKTVRPITPTDSEISGINILDLTGEESILSAPLIVSDTESNNELEAEIREETNMEASRGDKFKMAKTFCLAEGNEKDKSEIEVVRQEYDDFTESLLVSDSDSLEQTMEEAENVNKKNRMISNEDRISIYSSDTEQEISVKESTKQLKQERVSGGNPLEELKKESSEFVRKEAAEQLLEEPAKPLKEYQTKVQTEQLKKESAKLLNMKSSVLTQEEPANQSKEGHAEKSKEKSPENFNKESSELLTKLAEQMKQDRAEVQIEKATEQLKGKTAQVQMKQSAEKLKGETVETKKYKLPEVIEVKYGEVLTEEPTHQLQERPAEQLQEEYTEQLQEDLAYKIQENIAEQLQKESADQLHEEPAEQLHDESAEQLQGESAEQLQEEPAEQLQEESDEQLHVEPFEQLQEERAEQLYEESAEQLYEEPTEQVQEESAEQLQEEPAEQLCEELAEQLQEESAEQLQEESAEQLQEEYAEKLHVEPFEQLQEEPAEQLLMERADQLQEEAAEQMQEDIVEQLQENPARQLHEEPSEQPHEEPSEELAEHAVQLKDNPKKVLMENADEILQEDPTEELKDDQAEVQLEIPVKFLHKEYTEQKKVDSTKQLKQQTTEILKEKSAEIIHDNAIEVLKEASAEVQMAEASQLHEKFPNEQTAVVMQKESIEVLKKDLAEMLVEKSAERIEKESAESITAISEENKDIYEFTANDGVIVEVMQNELQLINEGEEHMLDSEVWAVLEHTREELIDEFKHFKANEVKYRQISSTPHPHRARSQLSRKTLGAHEDLKVTIDFEKEKFKLKNVQEELDENVLLTQGATCIKGVEAEIFKMQTSERQVPQDCVDENKEDQQKSDVKCENNCLELPDVKVEITNHISEEVSSVSSPNKVDTEQIQLASSVEVKKHVEFEPKRKGHSRKVSQSSQCSSNDEESTTRRLPRKNVKNPIKELREEDAETIAKISMESSQVFKSINFEVKIQAELTAKNTEDEQVDLPLSKQSNSIEYIVETAATAHVKMAKPGEVLIPTVIDKEETVPSSEDCVYIDKHPHYYATPKKRTDLRNFEIPTDASKYIESERQEKSQDINLLTATKSQKERTFSESSQTSLKEEDRTRTKRKGCRQKVKNLIVEAVEHKIPDLPERNDESVKTDASIGSAEITAHQAAEMSLCSNNIEEALLKNDPNSTDGVSEGVIDGISQEVLGGVSHKVLKAKKEEALKSKISELTLDKTDSESKSDEGVLQKTLEIHQDEMNMSKKSDLSSDIASSNEKNITHLIDLETASTWDVSKRETTKRRSKTTSESSQSSLLQNDELSKCRDRQRHGVNTQAEVVHELRECAVTEPVKVSESETVTAKLSARGRRNRKNTEQFVLETTADDTKILHETKEAAITRRKRGRKNNMDAVEQLSEAASNVVKNLQGDLVTDAEGQDLTKKSAKTEPKRRAARGRLELAEIELKREQELAEAASTVEESMPENPTELIADAVVGRPEVYQKPIVEEQNLAKKSVKAEPKRRAARGRGKLELAELELKHEQELVEAAPAVEENISENCMELVTDVAVGTPQVLAKPILEEQDLAKKSVKAEPKRRAARGRGKLDLAEMELKNEQELTEVALAVEESIPKNSTELITDAAVGTPQVLAKPILEEQDLAKKSVKAEPKRRAARGRGKLELSEMTPKHEQELAEAAPAVEESIPENCTELIVDAAVGTPEVHEKPIVKEQDFAKKSVKAEPKRKAARGRGKLELAEMEQRHEKDHVDDIDSSQASEAVSIEVKVEKRSAMRRQAARTAVQEHRDEVAATPTRRVGLRRHIDEHSVDEAVKAEHNTESGGDKRRYPVTADDEVEIAGECKNERKENASDAQAAKIEEEQTEKTVKGKALARRGGGRKKKEVAKMHKDEEIPYDTTNTETATDHIETADIKSVSTESKGRKRKESHTEHEVTEHSDEPAKKRIAKRAVQAVTDEKSATPSDVGEAAPRHARKESASNLDNDTTEPAATTTTPQQKPARNQPRRAAAAQPHNYDESSDNETTQHQSQRPQHIDVKVIDAVNTNTTRGGRTRKPTAKVQQFLEEERARTSTPKRRALLGVDAAATSHKSSAKRAHKPSTNDVDIIGTPRVATAIINTKRPRGRALPAMAISVESPHALVPEHKTADEELHESYADKKQPDNILATTSGVSSKSHARGARKVKLEQHNSDSTKEDEPVNKKSAGVLAAEKFNESIITTVQEVVGDISIEINTETQVPKKRTVRCKRVPTGKAVNAEKSDSILNLEEEKQETSTRKRAGTRAKPQQNETQISEPAEAHIEAVVIVENKYDGEEEDEPVAQVAEKVAAKPKRSRRKQTEHTIDRAVELGTTASATKITRAGRGGRKVVRFEPPDEVAIAAATFRAVTVTDVADNAAPASETTEEAAAVPPALKRATRTRRK